MELKNGNPVSSSACLVPSSSTALNPPQNNKIDSMADKLTTVDKQKMIASFLEIAVGQIPFTALQFLETSSWNLDEAIQLFYVGNEEESGANSSYDPPVEFLYGRYSRHGKAPTYDEEIMVPDVWAKEQAGTSMIDYSQDSLASLYRPPYALMYHGSFEQAKAAAAGEDKWLIVNLQSEKQFNSHMLNRDTWGNEVVAQTIKSSFIFWQMYNGKTEGMKVCTDYKVDSLPAVLIIDPITGQKMRSWSGMLHPNDLLEALIPWMDKGPRMDIHKMYNKASTSVGSVSKDEDEALQQAIAAPMQAKNKPGTSGEALIPWIDIHKLYTKASTSVVPVSKDIHKLSSKLASTSVASVSKDEDEALQQAMAAAPMEGKDKPGASLNTGCYPPLPDEPKGHKSMLCGIRFRLPDGRRLQRNFLRSDPIQLLWSFCYSQLKEEDKERGFQLVQAIPGSWKVADYDKKVAVGESGLSDSIISVRWE